MKASIFNIGLEGFMLVGTFFAILFVDLSGGNVYYGLLGGMIAGIIISLIYAVFVIWFKTDVIVAGIAVNLLALGITDFLPMPIWGTLGGYRPTTPSVMDRGRWRPLPSARKRSTDPPIKRATGQNLRLF